MIWFCFLPLNLTSIKCALNDFAAVCDNAGMKISSTKTEVLHLSRNPDQYSLQVSGASLKQVEKFKYLGVVFTSDGSNGMYGNLVGLCTEICVALKGICSIYI